MAIVVAAVVDEARICGTEGVAVGWCKGEVDVENAGRARSWTRSGVREKAGERARTTLRWIDGGIWTSAGMA